MGCFNKMGFYSKLPITYGDNIILIICGSYANKHKSETPCYVNEEIYPLFLPVIGKYDDYGSIECYDTSENSTSAVIENILQIKFKDLIDSIKRNAFLTLDEIKEEKEKMANTKSLYELSCNYEKALNKIIDISGFWPYNKDLTLTLLIERLDVYDKMSSLIINSIKDNLLKDLEFRAKNEINGFITDDFSIKRKFLMKCINENNKDNYSEQIKKTYDKIDEIIENGFQYKFHNGSHLCEGYKNTLFKSEKEFNDIIKFISFHECLSDLCGSYSSSQYGDQDIESRMDMFKELNTLYSSVIDSKLKKYNEECEN